MVDKLGEGIMTRSIYSYDECSLNELLCEFFYKINECVEESNVNISLLEDINFRLTEIEELVKEMDKTVLLCDIIRRLEALESQ